MSDLLLVVEACREHLLHAAADPPLDHDAMAVLLVALDDLRRDAAEVQRVVGDLFADTYPDKVYEGDGFTIEPRWSTSRTGWRNDELWADLRPVLVRRVLDPESTGERIGDEDTVLRTLAEVRRLANVSGSSMRTEYLRQQGIDPDEYALTSGRNVAQIRRLAGP